MSDKYGSLSLSSSGLAAGLFACGNSIRPLWIFRSPTCAAILIAMDAAFSE
ncbi:MAG: hypothetical protein ACPHF4_06700 [Rubripirellula sp.]